MNETLEVRVGVTPGRINNYSVNKGVTVKDVLELAGLDPSGFSIRYNGENVDTSAVVNEEGTILLAKQIKGNC